MKFSLRRPLSAVAVITLTAIVIALIVRHAEHGFALYLGDVAWFAFLIGALITAGLAASVALTHVLGRRYARSSVR